MRRGSRVDVCVRSPSQIRKEAAQVDCDGSLGSFFVSDALTQLSTILAMTNPRQAPSLIA